MKFNCRFEKCEWRKIACVREIEIRNGSNHIRQLCVEKRAFRSKQNDLTQNEATERVEVVGRIGLFTKTLVRCESLRLLFSRNAKKPCPRMCIITVDSTEYIYVSMTFHEMQPQKPK